MSKWQTEDPNGFKNTQSLYDLGTKVRGIWTNVQGVWKGVSGTIAGVTGFINRLRGSTDSVKTSMDAAGQSPFIKGIQELLDKIVSTIDIGSSLDNMFMGLNAALQQITPAWEALKNPAVAMAPVWQGLVTLLGFIVALLGVLATAIINVLGVALQWIVNTIAGVVQGFIWAFQGILTIIQGVWDVIVGILRAIWACLPRVWVRFSEVLSIRVGDWYRPLPFSSWDCSVSFGI